MTALQCSNICEQPVGVMLRSLRFGPFYLEPASIVPMC